MKATAKRRGKSKKEGLFLDGECILFSVYIGQWGWISRITSDRGEGRTFKTIGKHVTAEDALNAKAKPSIRECPIISIEISKIKR